MQHGQYLYKKMVMWRHKHPLKMPCDIRGREQVIVSPKQPSASRNPGEARIDMISGGRTLTWDILASKTTRA